MAQVGICQLHYSLLMLVPLPYKVLWLLKERGVHTYYALSPYCDCQFSTQDEA